MKFLQVPYKCFQTIKMYRHKKHILLVILCVYFNIYNVTAQNTTAPKTSSSTIFGSSFFNSSSLSFWPGIRTTAPANYILGPDDELIINISGNQELNIRPTVQPEGTVLIPRIGSINVAGLSINQAKTLINNKLIQTAYPSLKTGASRLIISLGKPRNIHITMMGASKPGVYPVSSLATVFNLINICGGPGEINTYRNIELIRNNKLYASIDLYKFLTSGDLSGNIPLKDGDWINFPIYNKRVSISGQVKINGTFELKDDENFEKLLFFAGGYTNKAYKASIRIKQLTDTGTRVKDVTASELLSYMPFYGDEFTVDAISDHENSVSIGGAVNRAGKFDLTPGLTIATLVKRAGSLQGDVTDKKVILTRTYPDGRIENIAFDVAKIMNDERADIPLMRRDVIKIAAINEYNTDYKVQITGEVNKPGEFAYTEGLSLKDILFLAGGFTGAAPLYNIEVNRPIISNRSIVDSIAKVVTVSTDKDLDIENNKFLLQPFDIVTVRNPGYEVQQSVSISGEVVYPGTYTIQSKKERISDLIKRAGGVTSFANSDSLYLIRQAGSDNAQQSVAVNNAQTNSRILINLKKVTENPGSVENYVLSGGDVVQVLKREFLAKGNDEALSKKIKSKGTTKSRIVGLTTGFLSLATLLFVAITVLGK